MSFDGFELLLYVLKNKEFWIIVFCIYIIFQFSYFYVTHKQEKHIQKQQKRIKDEIKQLELKLDFIENVHGYTAVTSLLRYDIKKLEAKLNSLMNR